MSLKGRLGRWQELAATVETWSEGTPATPLPGPDELASALGGRAEHTAAGPAVCIETRLGRQGLHGGGPLSAFLEAPLGRLIGLGAGPSSPRPVPRGLRPEDVLFWDTETSGLTGGAGTFVIMAGFGRFTSAGFTVRQYVLPNPGGPEEQAFLEAAAGELAAARVLVSFNGKAFDAHQMENRFIMAGLPREVSAALRSTIHVDLLHPARMLYRHHLPSCSLGRLEEAVLGYVRHDDIPGAEVPERYSAYLDGSDPDQLLPVLRHNRDDVLSLVSLAAHIGRLLARARRPAAPSSPDPGPAAGRDHASGDGWGVGSRYSRSRAGSGSRDATTPPPWPGELYGLARLHALRGYNGTAEALYRRFLAGAGGPPENVSAPLPPPVLRYLRRRAALELADLYRRARRWSEAEEVWRGLIARDRLSFGSAPACCRPHIELAKVLEHRRKDPQAALKVVDEAIARLRRASAVNSRGGTPVISRSRATPVMNDRRGTPSKQLADLLHRRRRLAAKVASVS